METRAGLDHGLIQKMYIATIELQQKPITKPYQTPVPLLHHPPTLLVDWQPL
jgi:hypothetical protein